MPRPPWPARLTRALVPDRARWIAAVDPHHVLHRPAVQDTLRRRGLRTLPSEVGADEFTLRAAITAVGEGGTPVAPVAHERHVPADLATSAFVAHLSLADAFPGLHVPTLQALPDHVLDALDALDALDRPPATRPGMLPLGAAATALRALRAAYGVDPDALTTPDALLAAMVTLHRTGAPPAPILDALLRATQPAVGLEPDLARRLAHDPALLHASLQRAWARALQDAGATLLRPPPDSPDLPVHPDAPPLADALAPLFLDGTLQPVEILDPASGSAGAPGSALALLGVRRDGPASRRARAVALIQDVRQAIPDTENAPADGGLRADWVTVAWRWARLLAVEPGLSAGDLGTAGPDGISIGEAIDTLRADLQRRFPSWLVDNLEPLLSAPPVRPALVHHVPRFLARRVERDPRRRVCLLCLDGIALDGWVVLADAVRQHAPDLAFEPEGSGATFAWVPTITPVSRQALFSGEVPRAFAETAGQTRHDGPRWAAFWERHGLSGDAVAYLRLDGYPDDLGDLRAAALHPARRAFGLVLSLPDEFAHAAKQGRGALYRELAAWARGGLLIPALRLLADRYDTTLTADHGTLSSVGIGGLREGVRVESGGHRARLYRAASLRDQSAARLPDVRQWPTTGLPDDLFPLLAPPGRAFSPRGKPILAHGGPEMEEVVVPLVRVSRRP